MPNVRESILIVDDEEVFREELRAALAELGYAVKAVPDFQTAMVELNGGLKPIFVFADRNVGGETIEDGHLGEIKHILPQDSLVIVYTRQSELTKTQELLIRSRGAVPDP